MKKATINISYDAEKLSALNLYLGQKNIKVEDELEEALDALYVKNVPSNVRNFIGMRSSGKADTTVSKSHKPKAEMSKVVKDNGSD